MPEIELVSFQGDPNIGIFMVCTDNYALVPEGTSQNFLNVSERVLHVPVHEINVDTKIIGVLICANKNGVILSHILHEQTTTSIKHTLPDLNIGKINSGYFAMGNLMTTNNKYTLISPIVNLEERKMIAETLQTEVITIRLAESDLIGSLLKITEQGGVISPIIDEEAEIDNVRSLLQLQIETSTVNRGFQFPTGGIIANSNGALLGNLTTGIETIAITRGIFPEK